MQTIEPDGKTTYYPFPGYEEEVNNGAVTRRTTYSLGGQAIALRAQVVGGDNALYYLIADRLGSTRRILSEGGSAVPGSTARYLPFGDWRTEPTANLTDRGFTGHMQENLGSNDLGLIYMRARFFVPALGRFASADTIVPDVTNPQQYNRYTYSLNSPLKYIDPSGHAVQCFTSGGTDEDNAQTCNFWMEDAILMLEAEGGDEGARLANLYRIWANDPDKLLTIYANSNDRENMSTRAFGDKANIYMGWEVVTGFERSEIALFGHELEHISQGAYQAWSIQGEVLAYQIEYAIRASMGADQSNNTGEAIKLDPYNYADVARADENFLNKPPYNVWYEPTLPWGEKALRVEMSDFNSVPSGFGMLGPAGIPYLLD